MLKKLIVTLSLLLSASWVAAEIRVVASITPLQLIAAEVLDGVATTDVLIPPGASPHAYSLRPSDARKLSDANLIVWVGPALEQFMIKPLKQSNANKLQLLTHNAEPIAAHSDPADHDEHGHHHHGGVDPHIWLDPVNALGIAEQIRDTVVMQYPELSVRINENFSDFARRLIATDRQLQSQLNPLSERGFITFHDAYQHFIDHYHLQELGSFTVNPSRKPGAKHLAQLRDKIADSQAVCIFSEPQFSDALIQAIIGQNRVETAMLDPLGQKIPAEKGAYITFLNQFGTQFVGCLSQ